MKRTGGKIAENKAVTKVRQAIQSAGKPSTRLDNLLPWRPLVYGLFWVSGLLFVGPALLTYMTGMQVPPVPRSALLVGCVSLLVGLGIYMWRAHLFNVLMVGASWLAFGTSLGTTLLIAGFSPVGTPSAPPLTIFSVMTAHPESEWRGANVWLPPTLLVDIESRREFVVFGVDADFGKAPRFSVKLQGARAATGHAAGEPVEVRDLSGHCIADDNWRPRPKEESSQFPGPWQALIQNPLTPSRGDVHSLKGRVLDPYGFDGPSCRFARERQGSHYPPGWDTAVPAPVKDLFQGRRPIVLEVVSESENHVVASPNSAEPATDALQATIAGGSIGALDTDKLDITSGSSSVFGGAGSVDGRIGVNGAIEPGVAFLLGPGHQLDHAGLGAEAQAIADKMVIYYGSDVLDPIWTRGVRAQVAEAAQNLTLLSTLSSVILGSALTLSLTHREAGTSRNSGSN